MKHYIGVKTQITGYLETEPIRRAAENLHRDIKRVCNTEDMEGALCTKIKLIKTEPDKLTGVECYEIKAQEDEIFIMAADELGFVYGIYEISRSLLGIADFWFWNDEPVEKRAGCPVPEDYCVKSKPFAVRYRGWFVNDEVLIFAWSVDRRTEQPWEMVFEALLRCGGNITIPGTDKNAKKYAKLASDMGLYITHHHAEPLGAEMFARAYPGVNPSYAEHPKEFQKLWQEGISRQKDQKVVWNLGFRGQGDCPFWVNDPHYQTDEARGELMSRLIGMQYDMVKKHDANAVCCTNLYGETMELYREGCLKLPEDVIKIWADNGFGKMVTRRQGNHNPRVCALPEEKDRGRHGIYYHVSFYDLQAANHITMLPNSPQFVQKELTGVLERGMKDYWIINCSNVKPHVYFLDFIAKMWREGTVTITEQSRKFVETYFTEKRDAADAIIECYRQYPKYALAYGAQEDEHAGEQFANHVARMLIYQYRKEKDKPMEELRWATGEETLKGQVDWYQGLCKKASEGYLEYEKKCEKTACSLEGHAEELFRDALLLQVKILRHCFKGAAISGESLKEAFAGNYQKAFYLAGVARKEYQAADERMREREHGKWHGFYQNECLTDVKQTAWVLEGLMSHLRNIGDGPHFFQWQRDFLYSKEDRRVMLILTMENHMKDEELFALMEEKWGN